jgi:predicted secreted protein
MKVAAIVFGVLCAIVAIAYFVMPAGSLPGFMPGFEPGSTRIHVKHGIAAAVVAVLFFVLAWWVGRRSPLS